MKKLLFSLIIVFVSTLLYGQTTYYWVGGTNSSNPINTGSNWNTMLDGSGTSRPSSTGTTDILIYDGTNVGGATPATGPVNVLANASISFAQLLFVNNVTVNFQRATSGTSTFTVNGGFGEDFVVNAGSTVNFISTVGSLRVTMLALVDSARVSGKVTVVTPQQFRFENGTAGTGIFRFTSGSSFYTNITSSSSSYAFGSSSQSSERWVVFENGSDLFYDGGYSPMGSNSTYSPVEFQPNSTYHLRATLAANGGAFFNRKSFGNISVENAASVLSDGPIYRVNNFTIATGSSFTTHTSGQTAINGNLTVNGTLASDAASTNEIVFSGNNTQTISGTGSIAVQRIIAGANSTVVVNKSLSADDMTSIYGKINFSTNQLTGAGTFTALSPIPAVTATVNTSAGSYIITGNTMIQNTMRGENISGAGIPAKTTIISVSASLDSIYISNALTGTATGITATVSSAGAILQTANPNGFTNLTGSVAVAGNKTYQDNISYIIDAATTSPFGISTGMTGSRVLIKDLSLNASATTNNSADISDSLYLFNGKLTLRPLDTLHLIAGAGLTAGVVTPFSASKYIATDYNAAGSQGLFQYDGINASKLLPIGTVNFYLPVTITPTSNSNFSANVFQGITTNGQITGTPYTAAQKQLLVNVVWHVERLAGTGNADVKLQWVAGVEGSTFATLPDTSIGLIRNNGTAFGLPIGTGNNALNFVTANLGSFGALGAGAKPPANPFIFNAIPVKTYGNPDFNPGANSQNTANPIVYTSSNTAVATILNGNMIHITGAGTSNIIASQIGDGFYPDTTATQLLTVNKAALTIKADPKTRFEQTPNPVFTATYTGFVLGETPANLLTSAFITTTATTASAPGNYLITISGATSNNYAITFINDTLKVLAKTNQVITFGALPVKTYGNGDFSAGATSTNITLPVTYTSSNTSVATVNASGIIHIVGAGTTDITASQAGSAGFFPAINITRALTVNKKAVVVTAQDATRSFGQPNPVFTVIYTGFVLGDTTANLTTPAQVVTTAMVNSTPGFYVLTPQGAVSQNYSFTYVNGRLTINPADTNNQQLFAYYSGSDNVVVKVYSPNAVALGDVLIYDMMGRHIATRNILIPVGFISTTINLPGIQSGSYVIAVRGKGISVQQIIQIVKN